VPVYVFACGECGPFEVSRPMAEAGDRACCPGCRSEARRVFTPPRLGRLARPVRRALETEEASAHEPRVVAEKRGRPLRQREEPVPPWVLH
jgi:putative FmdB family regulatory protein